MVYAVYFSPTGTSKRNACGVAGVFSSDFCEIDITVLSSVAEKKFDKNDLVVFSFPVYGGRIYEKALNALSFFKGENTPCVAIVTYGNRAYDFAFDELCTAVKKSGFVPFAGGALIGQHTYGEIATGRPNADDLKETAEFFAKFKEKVECGKFEELSENTNFKSESKGVGGRFFPNTSEDCISCGYCAKMCPVGAIDMKTFKVNSEKCIACFRCINICPKKAKNMNDTAYIEFAEGFSQRLSARLENKYFG